MTDSLVSSIAADPADRLAMLWDAGSAPDLEVFLEGHPRLVPTDLGAVIRVDQLRRWEHGDQIPVELYFARFPALRDDPSAALDLIHHEFILRESLGPPPSTEEFVARFPEHAATIRDQIAIHVALASAVDRRKQPVAGQSPESSTALPTDLSPTGPPTQFGRYTLLEPLGQGAMGTVYRARDDQLDRQVALKVMRTGLDLDGHLASRFLREARIAANFTDPRLCPVHDAGILNGFHYFTMPLISGETLAARIKRDGAMDRHVAARLVSMIARAVSIAHRAGVVHRDLKPANVMMTSEEQPVVLDFGLARRAAAFDVAATESGVVLGTPAYMAPEQIGGDSRFVGPAADVYSLGVILYQLLTGRLPFEGPPHELMRKALTQGPVPPTQLRPELEVSIEEVCLTAMARDITDRFPSMDAFADSLDSYLVGTESVPARPRRRRSWRRRAAWFALGAVVLLTGIGIYLAPTRTRSLTTMRAAASHFPKGAIWSGRFVFRGRLSGYEGDVVLTVTESHGDQFRAQYRTEEGKFEWEVSGTERDDHIHWEFVRATKGNVFPSIVGHAHVSGHYRNGVLELIFTDGDSSADVILTRST
jgi:serine/threonine protein kinase